MAEHSKQLLIFKVYSGIEIAASPAHVPQNGHLSTCLHKRASDIGTCALAEWILHPIFRHVQVQKKRYEVFR